MFESILCQVTEYDPDVLESLIGQQKSISAPLARPQKSAYLLLAAITPGNLASTTWRRVSGV
jgi:hypothetical protein